MEKKLTIPVANGCKPMNDNAMTQYSVNEQEQNVINPNKRNHLFQKGNQAAKGQRRGKQKLTTAFVDDLSYEWSTRGQAALRELSGDKLVQACIAILPKDVLVSLNQADKVQWVINSQPAMSTEQWLEQHNLIEQDTDTTD